MIDRIKAHLSAPDVYDPPDPKACMEMLIRLHDVVAELAEAQPRRFSGAHPSGDPQDDMPDTVDADMFDALQDDAKAVLKPMICDECGETRETRQTIDAYGQSFGVSHRVCRACYNDTPEPDTGRPDWEDLDE